VSRDKLISFFKMTMCKAVEICYHAALSKKCFTQRPSDDGRFRHHFLFCARRRRLKFGFNNINSLVGFVFKFGSCNPIYDE